jgi:WD40 repeat protein
LATRGGTIAVVGLDAPNTRAIIDTTFDDACAISFAPDDRQLDAVSCSGRTASWPLDRVSPPAAQREAYPGLASAEFAPRTRRAIWSNDSAEVRAVDAGSPGASRQLRPANVRNSRCAALSDDGQRVAVCTADGNIDVTDFTGTGAPTRIRTTRPPSSLAFSHSGAQLAIGDETGSTRIVGIAGADSGQLLTGQREPVYRIDFSRDDQHVLTSSDDGSVKAWDLLRGISTVTLRPRGPEVKSARWVADGRRIVTLGFDQGEARLWNADGSGGSVALPGDGAKVTQALASADGRWVLTTTDDQSAHLFPIDLGLALQPLRMQTVCLSVRDRRRYLSEPEPAAEKRFAACQERRSGRPATP